MSRHHSPGAEAPLDDEDLLQEILLRLPPKPSSLPRASLVCKRWRCILSDPRFLRRFCKHHRKPPLLGFFNKESDGAPFFTPMLDPPDRIPVANFALPENLVVWDQWHTLHVHLSFSFHGCRDGIALFLDRKGRKAVLWDPLSGVQCHVAFPPGFDILLGNYYIWSAAVWCSARDEQHVHHDRHLSPFKLVFVCHDVKCTKTSVCIYESMSGVWGDIISIATTDVISGKRPSILVGNALCWLLRGGEILEFDFERLTLAVIEKPADTHANDYGVDQSFQILRGEDNVLGLAVFSVSTQSIQLWTRITNCDGVISWVEQKTIQLDKLLSRPAHLERLFLMPGSESRDFILQLESMQFKYIGKRKYRTFRVYYPYTNFCTAGRGIAGGDGGAEIVNT